MKKVLIIIAIFFCININAQRVVNINTINENAIETKIKDAGKYLITSANYDAYSIIFTALGTSLVSINQIYGTTNMVLYAGFGCYFASIMYRFSAINNKKLAGLSLSENGIGFKIKIK